MFFVYFMYSSHTFGHKMRDGPAAVRFEPFWGSFFGVDFG